MTGESLVSRQLKISPEVEIASDSVLGWVTRVPGPLNSSVLLRMMCCAGLCLLFETIAVVTRSANSSHIVCVVCVLLGQHEKGYGAAQCSQTETNMDDK